MIRGIHHVAVHCRDIGKMAKFYEEAFGFEPIMQIHGWQDSASVDRVIDVQGSAGHTTTLRAGNCFLELFQYTAPEAAQPGPLRPFHRGYTHFCVDVTDIEQEHKRLSALGMEFGDRTPVKMGPMMALYGKDPEGNIVEILEVTEQCVIQMETLPKVAL
jgi:catechol 2,3-dioxygenase-like lactoylglutathione lyase family enzyme